MNTMFGKVSDNRRSLLIELKRKRSDQCTLPSKGAIHVPFPLQPSPISSTHKLAKRAKLDGSMDNNGSCAFPYGKRLLRYYSNFKKSGILHRLMYYYNDKWNDFSEEVIALVNKDLLVKKPAVEVEVNGDKVLLDFLQMMQVDMNTGVHHPIAWIDVSGNCFFPEVVSDCDDRDDYPYQFAGGQNCEGFEPQGSEINLRLEISIRGLGDESSCESNVIVEQQQIHENTVLQAKASDVEHDDKLEGGKQMDGNVVLGVDSIDRSVDLDVVKEMFSKAFSSPAAKIVEIHPCVNASMKCRLELFEKQVEITKKYRGDANVQYAWLPCSRGYVSTISQCGVGHFELMKVEPMHGLGLHLIPANGTQIGINYFDVDENDMRHMVLCRVIMGNMELIPCGSNQFHPSSDQFDSGVDKLPNPNHYVVWKMNVHSHIYPEYALSFKMDPDVEEVTSGRESESWVEIPKFGAGFGGPQAQAASRAVRGRQPKSPFLPFPVLFAAISNKVPSQRHMDLVKANYTLFKDKRISRSMFVTRLRMIVGDELLKSTILDLQSQTSARSSAGSGSVCD